MRGANRLLWVLKLSEPLVIKTTNKISMLIKNKPILPSPPTLPFLQSESNPTHYHYSMIFLKGSPQKSYVHSH